MGITSPDGGLQLNMEGGTNPNAILTEQGEPLFTEDGFVLLIE